MYLTDVFTVSAPLAGLPAISLPCGFSSRKLPIGLQLIGRPFEEAVVFLVADAYERATSWWKEEPMLRG
jgi:aspartyl-tRNA(Asn)/glutamyl-tRNA(Gln) amidotransferase subunit A